MSATYEQICQSNDMLRHALWEFYQTGYKGGIYDALIKRFTASHSCATEAQRLEIDRQIKTWGRVEDIGRVLEAGAL